MNDRQENTMNWIAMSLIFSAVMLFLIAMILAKMLELQL